MNLPPLSFQRKFRAFYKVAVGLLMARFVCLIFDPRIYYTAIQPEFPSITRHPLLTPPWDFLSNILYGLTNLFVIPVNTLFDLLKSNLPNIETTLFPTYPAMNSLYLLQVNITEHSHTWWGKILSPLTALDPVLTFPGVFDWLSLMAILTTGATLLILTWLIGELRHYGLVLWTEMTFSEQQQAQYEATVTQQSKDLASLNRNVDELSQTTSQLHGQTVTDEMTGAFNKRFFVGKLNALIQQANNTPQSFGLMMMDVDHFKKLNDTYGHAVGDDVLIALSKVAQSHTPEHNAYFCRYGGEEFGIIFDNYSLNDMIATGDAVRAGISSHTFEEHPEIRVTISQGLYVADYNTSTHTQSTSDNKPPIHKAEDIIKLADAKLYEAKESGRNCLRTETWP